MYLFLIFWAIILGLVTLNSLRSGWGTLSNYILPLCYLFLAYIGYKRVQLYKQIEYDNQNLYVVEDSHEVQVPLSDIESIELISIWGEYRINFYQSLPGYTEIYFKAAHLYPFGFKKADKEVDLLRYRIERSRQAKLDSGDILLASQNPE